jgi:hypothetical protein
MKDAHTRADVLTIRGGTTWLRRAAAVLLSAAREIFDEAAYDRFLTRTRTTSSVKSYESFCKDYEAVRTTRPRCC